ncbi:hypothetical protein PMI04_016585 [Sphingobium sp. AP49]|uniref:hypothetical protein n=1 Tax=Sphingobium sp. AP49 TaxID=1144307 RepID=UPI0024B3357F|nr:hypothetical protein [Sphingobium sp. AP49]WHO38160.1 hypothetical protein PMI04_016585 [Sphingobium sp. AP49]
MNVAAAHVSAPALKEQLPAKLNVTASPQAGPQDAIIINVPSANLATTDKGWDDATATIAIAWAWPFALIIVLLIFRQPITRFIDRLRSFKGAGMEATTEAMIHEELPTRAPPVGTSKVEPGLHPSRR